VVACGVTLVDGVTGLLRFPLDDELLVVVPEPVELSWSPLLPWLAWSPLPAWVVSPMPTAAPTALTRLSPARPACTRRLRLMCVMPSTMGRASVRIL
jgi:hypothetical protein